MPVIQTISIRYINGSDFETATNSMWNRTIPIAIILLVLAGCQSPRAVSTSLQHTNTRSVSLESFEQTSVQTSEAGTIEEYVQLGLARNPRIQEAQHKIDAIRHRVPQVLSLPDPIVNTNTHLSPVQTAAGEQAFSLGVSQKFTNAERRAAKAAIVCEEIAAAEAALTQTQLEIAEDIRTACFQLLFIRKSIEITNEDRDTLEQISEVVLRQYEVKESVTQQDVLNIQTEQSNLDNQLTELLQKEKSYQSRLARLLHVSPQSDLQINDQLETSDADLNIEALIVLAIQTRPDLKVQIATIRRDSKKVHLAKLEAKPDFTVGLNWIATSSDGISPVANGDDALLLGVGFNLPVYKSRIRAGICEAHANRLVSQSRLASAQDQAAEEVFDLVTKIDSTRETLTLVQGDILPKAERTLEIAIDEYATGSIDYVQLIANWRNVLRYRITEANLQSQFSQSLASLARAVGQLNPITTQPSSSSQPPLETTDEPKPEEN